MPSDDAVNAAQRPTEVPEPVRRIYKLVSWMPWWAQGLFGVLVVGALGNGVWDWGWKPALIWIAQAALRVLTLGSDAINDAIYSSAAQRPDLNALNLVVWGVLFVWLRSFGPAWRDAQRTVRKAKRLRDRVGASLARVLKLKERLTSIGKGNRSPIGPEAEITIEREPAATVATLFEAMKEVEDLREAQQKKWNFLRIAFAITRASMLLSFAWPIVIGFILSLHAILAVEVVRQFDTNIAVCAPVLSDEDEEKLRGQFAAMRSGAEYRAIQSQVRALAAKHSLRISDVDLTATSTKK